MVMYYQQYIALFDMEQIVLCSVLLMNLIKLENMKFVMQFSVCASLKIHAVQCGTEAITKYAGIPANDEMK